MTSHISDLHAQHLAEGDAIRRLDDLVFDCINGYDYAGAVDALMKIRAAAEAATVSALVARNRAEVAPRPDVDPKDLFAALYSTEEDLAATKASDHADWVFGMLRLSEKRIRNASTTSAHQRIALTRALARLT